MRSKPREHTRRASCVGARGRQARRRRVAERQCCFGQRHSAAVVAVAAEEAAFVRPRQAAPSTQGHLRQVQNLLTAASALRTCFAPAPLPPARSAPHAHPARRRLATLKARAEASVASGGYREWRAAPARCEAVRPTARARHSQPFHMSLQARRRTRNSVAPSWSDGGLAQTHHCP